MKSLLLSSRTRRAYRFTLTTFFICTCLVGLAQPGWSQMPNGHETRGILGYLNPRKVLSRRSSAALVRSNQKLSSHLRQLVFNIQISIWSTIPQMLFSCSGAASVYEATSGHFSNETASVDATRNGNKASCQVIIPYYWSLLKSKH